ncbi:HAMP domain-containing protein [bacterium]|nr:HAMP domain-containing protein [bacterium]
MWFVLIGLIPLGTSSFIFYRYSVASIREQVFGKLTTVAEEKVLRVEGYFRDRKKDVAVLAQQPAIIEALQKLSASDAAKKSDSKARNAIENDLTFTSYYIETYEYHDLFLILPSGDIVFTVVREKDLGTNLLTSPYSRSALGEVFYRVKTSQSLQFSKFEYFEPSQLPSLFLGAPVVIDGEFLGVVAVQLTDSKINKIIEEQGQFGKTSEIIIGTKKDNKVIFLSPLMTHPEAAFQRENLIGSKLGIAMQYAVQGQNGSGIYGDYDGTSTLAVWRYLPELDWGIVAKINTKEVFAPIDRLERLYLVIGIFAVLTIITLAFFVSKSITHPLIRLKEKTAAMTAGDLTVRADVSAKDEIGELAHAFNDMIEARQKAEKATQLERGQLLSMFEGIGEVVYVADPETNEVVYMNGAARKLWGDGVGKKCYKVIQGLDSPCSFCSNRHILGENTGRPYVCDCQNALNHNWYRCTDKAIRWPDGRMVRLEFAIDITERKQTEIELAEHRDHLEELVQERSAEIGRTNKQLQQEIADRKRVEEELKIQNDIADIFLNKPDDSAYYDILNTVLKTMNSQYGALGYINENGALIVPTMSLHAWERNQVAEKSIVFPHETWGDSIWAWAMQSRTTLYSNEPSTLTPEGHISISRNISSPIVYQGKSIGLLQIANKETDYNDRDVELVRMICNYLAPILHARLQADLADKQSKRAEEQLKKYADELQRSNRELEVFANVASHDLQEPLRKVQAFGERLYRESHEQIGEQGKGYMERMQSAVSRMQALLNDLLTYSRVATKAKLYTPVEMDDVAREVISDLELMISRTGGQVNVEHLLQVEADPIQIRQLLQNLISNSLKFRKPNEPPVVTISSRYVGKEGANQEDYYEITLEDNGIGFDEKYVDEIFLPFRRLHSRTEYEGTGIGLAVCRRIVGRHGGSISAQSTEGKGSKFIIRLPKTQTKSEVTNG